MKMIEIGGASAEQREAFLAIYEEALPPSERKPRDTILGLAARADFRVMLWLRGEVVTGFAIVFVPPGEDFALLEYLGVLAGERGRGTGAAILGEVLAAIGERLLVIEVDSDREESADRETRTRRRSFYERAGARRLDGVDYRMPRVGEGMPPAMDLMLHARGKALRVTPARAGHWIRTIYRGVYGIGIGERDVQAMLRGMTEAVA